MDRRRTRAGVEAVAASPPAAGSDGQSSVDEHADVTLDRPDADTEVEREISGENVTPGLTPEDLDRAVVAFDPGDDEVRVG